MSTFIIHVQNFLYQEQGFMSGYEMFAVMATVATYPLYSRERLRDMYYGAPHPRSTHLSIAVIRTFSLVLAVMAACGYPVPISGVSVDSLS